MCYLHVSKVKPTYIELSNASVCWGSSRGRVSIRNFIFEELQSMTNALFLTPDKCEWAQQQKPPMGNVFALIETHQL